MARKFNLQPWRERLREAQRKQFIATTAGIVAIAVAFAASDDFFQKQSIERYEVGISRLKSEIDSYKKTQAEIKRLKDLNAEVTQQVTAIDILQAQRPFVVELLDHLSNNVPQSVFLKEINYDSVRKTLVVRGIAENESGISELLRSLEKFPKLGAGRLDKTGIVKAKANKIFKVSEDTTVKEFTIVFPVIQDDKNSN